MLELSLGLGETMSAVISAGVVLADAVHAYILEAQLGGHAVYMTIDGRPIAVYQVLARVSGISARRIKCGFAQMHCPRLAGLALGYAHGRGEITRPDFEDVRDPETGIGADHHSEPVRVVELAEQAAQVFFADRSCGMSH